MEVPSGSEDCTVGTDQRILGNSLLHDLAALTNSIYRTSEHGALMNRFPVMMTPREGWREFPTIFRSEGLQLYISSFLYYLGT